MPIMPIMLRSAAAPAPSEGPYGYPFNPRKQCDSVSTFLRESLMNQRTPVSVRRAFERGMSLVEVMIVVVIIGLIASGAALSVFPKLKQAQVDTTKTGARTIRQAAETWRGGHGSDECPTPKQLIDDKQLDTASKISDAWDKPYKIFCEEEDTFVTSGGPDKKEGTADDIKIPEPQK